MLQQVGIDDLQLAYYKKRLNEAEQEAEASGASLHPTARDSLFAEFARDGRVDISVIRAHFEPTWSDQQLEAYEELFNEYQGSMPDAEVRKYAKQTGVTFEYACQQLGHTPTPKTRRGKRAPAKKQEPAANSK